MDKPGAHVEYNNLMKKLAAVLKSISNKTQIIWLHQNPIIETYGSKNFGAAIKRTATQSKYDNYNLMARQHLK
jgi:hypothetical protein